MALRRLVVAAASASALAVPTCRESSSAEALTRDDIVGLSLLQRQHAPTAVRSPQAPTVRGSLHFVHIAKCAGSSFTRALEELVRAWNQTAVTAGVPTIRLKHRPEKVIAGYPKSGLPFVMARNQACPDPNQTTFVLEEVVGFNLDQYRRDCGLEEVTLLRDPIDRAISLYQYYNEVHKQIIYNSEFGPEDLSRRVSPETCQSVATICNRGDPLLAFEKCWLWKGDCGVWVNHEVLALAGERPTDEPFDERLRIASEKLDSMPFFGITEYYRQSMCLFLDTWFPSDSEHFDACCQGAEPSDRCTLLETYNVEGRVNKHEVSDPNPDYRQPFLSQRKTAEALLEGNRYDCKLYTYALRTFRTRVQALEKKRGTFLGPVLVPREGVDYCDEKMAHWL